MIEITAKTEDNKFNLILDSNNINNLPNPLCLIYQITSGKTLDVEYINFPNMPSNGINGISSRMVFAYTSTEEGITPGKLTGGSVNFETNEIIYPDGWGPLDNLTGVVWFSTCEFFSDTTSSLTWSTPIRITGAKGDEGDDGVSAYHIEISNDADQVYTTDDKVIINGQTVETVVSILSGNQPMKLDASSVTITSVEGFSVTTENINNDEYNVVVKIELTGETLTAISYDFNIIVDGDNYGASNYDFVKTFKVRNLNGTIDYDLNVSPTYIKIDKEGELETSELTIGIIQKDISINEKTVTNTTVIPSGYTIKVEENKKDGSKNTSSYTNNELELTHSISDNNLSYITVSLINDETSGVVDYVKVETLRDGSKGDDGISYTLDLSNDMGQIYTSNNLVIGSQTASTTVYLSNILNKIVLEEDDVKIYNNSIEVTSATKSQNDSGITINIPFNENDGFINDNEITYNISVNYNGYTFNKIFKVIKINGSVGYDLDIVPSVVRLDKSNVYSPTAITLNVNENKISTTGVSSNKVDVLPGNYSVKCYVDNLVSYRDVSIYTRNTHISIRY